MLGFAEQVHRKLDFALHTLIHLDIRRRFEPGPVPGARRIRTRFVPGHVTGARPSLARVLRTRLANQDPKITGFNVGVNCGLAAGQTVMHAHIHLIPRRSGDTDNPRGGVRGVIPARMAY